MSTGKSGSPRYPQAWPLASILLSSEALGYPRSRYLSGLPGFLPCFILDTHLPRREPELLHPPHRVKGEGCGHLWEPRNLLFPSSLLARSPPRWGFLLSELERALAASLPSFLSLSLS